jgi:hypothetical protein
MILIAFRRRFPAWSGCVANPVAVFAFFSTLAWRKLFRY